MNSANKITAAPLKLLLVDDEVFMREELSSGLTALGFSVVTAAEAVTAFELIKADPSIEVLVTDIRMPGPSGLDLLRQVMAARGEDAPLEVVMISGHANVDQAAEALREGAVDFLPKPFTLDEAEAALHRAFARARARRAKAAGDARLQRALVTAEAGAKALGDRLAEALARLIPSGSTTPGEAQDRDQLLAHGLRTPLVPVLGYAELLGSPDLNLADVPRFGREIAEGARQLLGNIDKLMEHEHLNDPTLRAHRKVQPLADVALAAHQQVAPLAASRGVAVHLQVPAALHPPVDAALLRLALVDVLDNAVRASPPQGMVTLLAEPEGTEILLKLRDQGPGLPPALLANGPAAFSTGLPALNYGGQGMGLGLALAQRAMVLQGGRLALHNRAEGGAEVVLHLPAA